jgi:hypothetical protein
MRPPFRPGRQTTRRLTAFAALLAGLALAGSATSLAAAAALRSSAPNSIPKHPRWKSSQPFGAWNNGGFIVYNNEWNTSQAGPQTIWADSYHYWGVQSKQANTTSVKVYPCVQKDYSNVAYTRFTKLTSTFAESMPTAMVLDAEAAYDIWLNNYQVEVMIWVDDHKQVPAGNIIRHVTINKQKFALWQGSKTMYSFELLGKQETKGAINVLSFLSYLVSHHYLSRNDTMAQVNFGWEIASTGNRPMDFTVTRYSLTTGLKR